MILPTAVELERAKNELGRRILDVADALAMLTRAEATLEVRRATLYATNQVVGSNDTQRKASERELLGAEHAAVLRAKTALNAAQAAKAVAELDWLYLQALMRLAEITASPIGGMIESVPVDERDPDDDVPF